MKRMSDDIDDKPSKRRKIESTSSPSTTDGFAKELEVTASTLADDHLNEAGHIVGQVFMLWPMSNQSRKLQLKILSDSLDVVFQGPGLEKLDFVSRDRVMIRLKGVKKEAKKAGSPHTLPFRLVYSNGAIVKFLGSEKRQEEKIVDLFQDAEDEKRRAEDDWFCPPEEIDSSTLLRDDQTWHPEPSDLIVASYDRGVDTGHIVEPVSSINSVRNPGDNESASHYVHRIGINHTEVIPPTTKAITPTHDAKNSENSVHYIHRIGTDYTETVPPIGPVTHPSSNAANPPPDPKSSVAPAPQTKEKRIKKRDLRHSEKAPKPENPSLPENLDPHVQIPEGKKAKKKRLVAQARAEREQAERSPPPPDHDPALDLIAGFHSDKGGVYTPIGNMVAGATCHLVGAVADVGPIKRTKVGDLSRSYTMVDPSNQESRGLTVNIFVSAENEHLLPSTNTNQVLLLRNIKCKEFNGKAQGTGYKDSFQWCGYDPSEGKHFYTVTPSHAQTTFFIPSTAEMEYFVKLADWWRAMKESEEKARLSMLNDPGNTNHIVVPRWKKRQKLQTVSQFEPGTFVDCVVELLRIWKDDTSSDIYVTDYSENQYLQPYVADVSVLGMRTLKVSLWDGANTMVEDLELNGLYLLKNLRLRTLDGRTFLEGHMGYDDRGIYRLGVRSNQENLQELLSRKKEYESNPNHSKLQPAEDKSNFMEPMQQGHQPVQKNVENSGLMTCSHMDQKRSTVEDVLRNKLFPNKFRVRARVVDYYPRDIQDFVIVECTRCYKVLDASHHLCPECGDLTGKLISTRYQFALRIVDESQEELNVNVSDADADNLLIGLDPEAARDDVAAFRSRLKPLIGHLERWHADFDPNAKEEGPLLDMCLSSWLPEDVEGTGNVTSYKLFGCELQQ